MKDRVIKKFFLLTIIHRLLLILMFYPILSIAQVQTWAYIIEPQFDNANNFSEGYAAVKKWNKWGYIDKNGKQIIDFQFDFAGKFSEGIAVVQKGDKWGYINKQGEMVSDFIYPSAFSFSDGLAKVRNPAKRNLLYGFINRKGNLVIDYHYYSAESFSEGLAGVNKGNFGFIDKQGKIVVKPQFTSISPGGFTNGLAAVEKDKMWGYINQQGVVVIGFRFDFAFSFSDNNLACVKMNGKYGFIDRQGNIIIDCQFQSSSRFYEGLACVKRWDKYGYIDCDGKLIIDYKFAYADEFYGGLAAIKTINGSWGFIDREGNIIIQGFQKVKPNIEGLAAALERDSEWGYIVHKSPIYLVQKIVEQKINQWQQKGKYEKTTDYLSRVTEQFRKLKAEQFKKEAVSRVALEYCSWEDITSEYDADNEVCKITVGGIIPFYIKVPINEAQQFEENLQNLSFSKQQYALCEDDAIMLLYSEIYNPNNSKHYTYLSGEDHQFNIAQIDMNFDPLDISIKKEEVLKPTLIQTSIKVGKSDVDINIPVTSVINKNTFAVVIGNENYENEIPVNYAIIDAQTFKKYAVKTLGVPENQIHYLQDATFADMLDEIEWLNSITDAFENEARIIFYYAGHGMPDEASKSAYLLPVNGTSSRTRTAIQVDELYAQLTEYPTKQVTVILDACFSGSSRNGMISSGRGVKIKPKENLLQGNLVVFSAVSGDETAHPYNEKQHGVFTYFLLKKLQETKGNISYKELSDYITTEVTRLSVINNKEQNPWINASDDIESEWENWRFR